MFNLRTLLEDKGEIMVRMDSGEEFELHTHNVEFGDLYGEKVFKIETADEVEVLRQESVESVKWHYTK